MRILHLTDTHLGARAWFTGAPGDWSRAADHHRALELALQPALEDRVDLVLHTGDVFDRSSPPAQWVHAFVALMREVARHCPVVLMPGNHDRHGLSRHMPVPGPGITVVDDPTRLEIGGVALGVVPFTRIRETWTLRAKKAIGPGVDLLLAHQAFDGHRVPGLTFLASRRDDTIGAEHLPDGVRHVLTGHLHPRQVVQVGEATVVCPGSTERTAFSEEGQTKGTALWELGRELRWSFVDLPSRPRLTVRTPADLAGVVPGTLVRLAGPVAPEEVHARGGWLTAPRKPGPPRVRQATPLLC